MMLPHVESATVDAAKVHDYLLSPSHPVGRFKAVVFHALGYTQENWRRLQADLLALAKREPARPGQISEYGQKFEVSGSLEGPNGRKACFVTVWLLPVDGTGPRFITAFPE